MGLGSRRKLRRREAGWGATGGGPVGLNKMNPIRCKQGASLLGKGEACGRRRKRGTTLSMSKCGPSSLLVGLGQADREGLMWKMRELSENRTVFMAKEPEEPAGSSQSVHSSDEAGNDRGAKGRRKEKP
jgi:hypothetical protein